jgi:hypothetical protein
VLVRLFQEALARDPGNVAIRRSYEDICGRRRPHVRALRPLRAEAHPDRAALMEPKRSQLRAFVAYGRTTTVATLRTRFIGTRSLGVRTAFVRPQGGGIIGRQACLDTTPGCGGHCCGDAFRIPEGLRRGSC